MQIWSTQSTTEQNGCRRCLRAESREAVISRLYPDTNILCVLVPLIQQYDRALYGSGELRGTQYTRQRSGSNASTGWGSHRKRTLGGYSSISRILVSSFVVPRFHGSSAYEYCSGHRHSPLQSKSVLLQLIKTDTIHKQFGGPSAVNLDAHKSLVVFQSKHFLAFKRCCFSIQCAQLAPRFTSRVCVITNPRSLLDAKQQRLAVRHCDNMTHKALLTPTLCLNVIRIFPVPRMAQVLHC